MDYVVMVAEDETYCHEATDRLSTFQTIEYQLERLSFAPSHLLGFDLHEDKRVCLPPASKPSWGSATPIIKSQVQEFLESVRYC